MGRKPARARKAEADEKPAEVDAAAKAEAAAAAAEAAGTADNDQSAAQGAAATPPIVAGEPYTGPPLERFAGVRQARGWAERLIRDIADYKAGRIRWEDVDRGAVLCGPPGTGKTTFVRALAAASGLPLFVTGYRDWMSYRDGHQGTMMQAMQKVFDQAKAQRPSIILIDEIDSMPSRSALAEHRDWYVALVNALLELVDGGQRREGIIVLGACNDASRLDPARVRPGRLDRKIVMELPSIEEIVEILEFHTQGSVKREDLAKVAVLATGQTGAELEALAREARRAARHEGRAITLDDLMAAVTGLGDKVPEDLVRRTAVHEAGHAFAALRLGIARSVSVSVVRRGESLGAARIERIVQGHTLSVIEREIAVSLAGRAAEDVVLGCVSSGAGGGDDSDLARATGAATRLVTAWGLSECGGLLWYGEGAREHILLTNPRIAGEVRETLDRCYAMAADLVRRERESFDRLVEALVVRRGLEHDDIMELIGPSPDAAVEPESAAVARGSGPSIEVAPA